MKSNKIKLFILTHIKMLQKVKSTFFTGRVFSYLDDKQILKLVRHNKRLQQAINISINNYINFKGSYIIYESKGKGKEYDDNGKLKFEGEYLNGKRNGKGKEYINNILIFEGEYLNGKRNGKGKEYYGNGKLRFEGEFLNNKKSIGIE